VTDTFNPIQTFWCAALRHYSYSPAVTGKLTYSYSKSKPKESRTDDPPHGWVERVWFDTKAEAWEFINNIDEEKDYSEPNMITSGD